MPQLTGVLGVLIEQFVNLLTNLTFGNLDVILGLTIIAHEGEEAIVRHVKLEAISQRRQTTKEVLG